MAKKGWVVALRYTARGKTESNRKCVSGTICGISREVKWAATACPRLIISDVATADWEIAGENHPVYATATTVSDTKFL
jgi:hypothetical protein